MPQAQRGFLGVVRTSSITQQDVLLGHEPLCKVHSGTIALKALLESKFDVYRHDFASKDKTLLTAQIVRRTLATGGRFLIKRQQHATPDIWYELNSSAARVKVRDYFRNNMHNLPKKNKNAGSPQSSYNNEGKAHLRYIVPTANDVLCGRGRNTFEHPGNKALRNLIGQRIEQYRECKRREQKTNMIHETIQVLRAKGGRFLKFDQDVNKWYDGGRIAAKSRVGVAYRDASAAIGRALQASKSEAAKVIVQSTMASYAPRIAKSYKGAIAQETWKQPDQVLSNANCYISSPAPLHALSSWFSLLSSEAKCQADKTSLNHFQPPCSIVNHDTTDGKLGSVGASLLLLRQQQHVYFPESTDKMDVFLRSNDFTGNSKDRFHRAENPAYDEKVLVENQPSIVPRQEEKTLLSSNNLILNCMSSNGTVSSQSDDECIFGGNGDLLDSIDGITAGASCSIMWETSTDEITEYYANHELLVG